MTLEHEIQVHKAITDAIHKTFKSKRQDYGQTTTMLLKKYGPVSMLTLLYTKLERIDNLTMNNKTPNNESVRDSLLDLANYCIIWLVEMEKAWLAETKKATAD